MIKINYKNKTIVLSKNDFIELVKNCYEYDELIAIKLSRQNIAVEKIKQYLTEYGEDFIHNAMKNNYSNNKKFTPIYMGRKRGELSTGAFASFN